MIGFGTRFLQELLGVFLDASPYILFGFVVAAVIQVFVPPGAIEKILGRGRVRPILAAAAIGIPLPLCSCSVLPTAMSLRKRGASRGATVSFLISTPETDIDSIVVTWGLMDPLMAIYRTIAGTVTAIVAGFAAEVLGREEGEGRTPADGSKPAEPHEDHGHDHSHDVPPGAHGPTASFREKLRRGFVGAFVELFDETSHWMFAGLVISALITMLLPAELVTRYLSSGPLPILLMLLIGIPLYICATASTPIAAALVLKGLSPGAALVFLLAGPATNIGSLGVLSRFLGKRVTVIYVASIAVMSVAFGALLDVVYRVADVTPGAKIGAAGEFLPAWLAWSSAIVFVALLAFSFRRARVPREFVALGRGIQWLLGFRVTRRRLAGLVVVAVALWAVASCFVIVPPGHQGLVRRFGAPSGEPRAPGLHWRWPAPIGSAQIVATDHLRRVEIGFRSAGEPAPGDAGGAVAARELEEESLHLTGDENLISMKSVVQYRIVEPEKFVYGFLDPDRTIKQEVLAEMLDVLASFPIDRIYGEDRRLMETLVLDGLKRRAQDLDLGVEILRYAILDVHAPPEVHAAFRDVASAHEDKQTSVNVAYRYLTETVNLARGEAAGTIAEAQSFAVGEVNRARGESQSLALRSAAYRKRPTGTFTRLYLETVEEVLARGRKIIRPGWKGSGHVDLWISTGSGTPVPVDEVLRGGEVRRGQAEELPPKDELPRKQEQEEE